MRVVIFEDSDHNLDSAREFAEKVKGEHEVKIVDRRPGGHYWDIEQGHYDIVLTDLFMPEGHDGGSLPSGLFTAMRALQCGIPVAIVTDGATHSADPVIDILSVFFLDTGNERLRVFFVNPAPKYRFADSESPEYSPMTGVTPDGKPIKDWEFCFRRMTQKPKTK